ncbi:hypothetical protein JD276_06055 [Leucobacter sp. CSA1]|uniref:Uncharacterized protein n=1 Tax=Leucobacter chromiisoli TaxID=2796471 RepID=A0A934UUM8_9MICO|nr:hypothetical protein [Leucobacter chromiisoli]MBK0418596.1 hypothetical protein [Leucobacter chromiisoli]
MNPFRLTTRLSPAPRVDPGARPAAAVPWRVASRSDSGVIEFEHCGPEPLRGVRFFLAGGGLLGLSLPRTVHPGERLRVVLRGVHADEAVVSADSMLVLRWFHADGTELLWPIAL